MPSRRRRCPDSADARQSLLDAFWTLLSEHPLREITVSMLAAQAHVNRGTFYYHYADLNELVLDAIERELVEGSSFATVLFSIVAGEEAQPVIDVLNDPRTHKLSLIMEKGDRRLVEDKIENAIVTMWKSVLCPDGSDLSHETRLAIEYSIGGMMGVVAYTANVAEQNAEKGAADPQPIGLPIVFIRSLSSAMLTQMSQDKGISKDEILSRLRAVCKFTSLPRDMQQESKAS